MTLTNRLTLLALAALAVILAGFSGATYALAATHLHRQLDDRAAATLDTLVAATEAEADGLEWEPKNRVILPRGDGEPPVWAVYDQRRRVDGTADPAHSLDDFAAAGAGEAFDRATVTRRGDRWRVARRTLRHPHPEAVRDRATPNRYRALTFVTAWPFAPVSATLRALAWGLGGVSMDALAARRRRRALGLSAGARPAEPDARGGGRDLRRRPGWATPRARRPRRVARVGAGVQRPPHPAPGLVRAAEAVRRRGVAPNCAPR